MKHVRKTKPPRPLVKWYKSNANIPDAQYGTHGFPTIAVHEALLAEQGWICAYTMIRVEDSSSHIEHLKPQTVSRNEGAVAETADYSNVVACYPREQVKGAVPISYGAIYRGSQWDEARFISPLSASCEAAYKYGVDGSISPGATALGDPQWMITILGLDSGVLVELRLASIEAFGLSLTAENPASAREARDILAAACKPDRSGRLIPYCMAIKHAAERYLQVLERNANRKKYIRDSKSRRRK
ncbi:MAG: hypothetical protein KDA96_07450 [Planctomycetaceae bacterium]|nr:hypothetical protein [Planctomycetaceae bacterium]